MRRCGGSKTAPSPARCLGLLSYTVARPPSTEQGPRRAPDAARADRARAWTGQWVQACLVTDPAARGQ